MPSALNSQSTRIVLLLGDEHKKLWNIVKETLKARISAEAFAKTEAKIDGCFASGHGTVLYFEDTSVVKKLQEAFPSYKDNFPTWSQHTSAMHQFAIWTMLEDMGLGASLQHYNPLIDDEVRRWVYRRASVQSASSRRAGSKCGVPRRQSRGYSVAGRLPTPYLPA